MLHNHLLLWNPSLSLKLKKKKNVFSQHKCYFPHRASLDPSDPELSLPHALTVFTLHLCESTHVSVQ